MKDTELYAQMLGITKPWEVTGVHLDVGGKKVEVRLACAEQTWWGNVEGERLPIHDHVERSWLRSRQESILQTRHKEGAEREEVEMGAIGLIWLYLVSGRTLARKLGRPAKCKLVTMGVTKVGRGGAARRHRRLRSGTSLLTTLPSATW